MNGAEGNDYLTYLRKSKGRAGISRQRTVLSSYISRQGGRVAAGFRDEDGTAFRAVGAERPVRPQFDDLLAAIRTSPPGTRVAAWHADRLLRDLADSQLLIEPCVTGNHLVETPSGGVYDLATATGRKRLRSDVIDAAFEVDHLVERVTAQKDEAAAAGRPLGGRRPLGYRAACMTLHTGELVMKETEAARRGLGIIRMTETRNGMRAVVMLPYSEAAELAAAIAAIAAGTACNAIAGDWNRRGVRTAAAYAS